MELLNSLILETTVGPMPAELAILRVARCGGAEILVKLLQMWSAKEMQCSPHNARHSPPSAAMVRVGKLKRS